MGNCTGLPPGERAIVVSIDGQARLSGIVTIWQVVVHGPGGQVQQRIVRIGMTADGDRSPLLERIVKDLRSLSPATAWQHS